MSNVFKQLISMAHGAWFQQRRKGLRRRIYRQYGGSPDPEVKEVLGFLNQHPELPLPTGMTPPYEWTREYRPEAVLVERDSGNGLLHVKINGQRVFFPRHATPAEVQLAVSIGQMEQDRRSPHRYVGEGFNVDPGDVAVFIGASDGLFCLSLIDRLAKAYLFEPGTHWHEPLRATFAAWGGKVEIIPAAVGSTDGDGRVTLDHFFKDRQLPNYIQVDVDGGEQEVLAGAGRVLREATKLRLSLCTYHKRLDFPGFENQLAGLGYAIGHSPGFYLIGVRMPYLRRGILYAARGVSAPPR